MTYEQPHSNKIPLPLGKIGSMALDLMSSFGLLVYALLLGPLGVLRGPLVLEKALCYLGVLLPQRLVARSVRAAIDWRIGRFDAAIGEAEAIVGSCESYVRRAPESSSRRRVLEDLYTLLARAYMHAGHIDDAMVVVIRAKKVLGVERLSGLAELDAKTAHLVRAGLAAGRLLDGTGLATMFVKSSQPEVQPKTSQPKSARIQGASKSPLSSSQARSAVDSGDTLKEQSPEIPASVTGTGKVIPFPVLSRTDASR